MKETTLGPVADQWPQAKMNTLKKFGFVMLAIFLSVALLATAFYFLLRAYADVL